MRIQVSTLTGKTANISLNKDNSTVESLSTQVEEVFGVPMDEQKLIFNNQKLTDGSLSVFGLSEESNSNIIYMLVDIDGGKGKKKKKKTKKPKKPHRKRKVNLAILKYFKIEGGEVVRLRQQSQVGTYMAEHKDRYYCGKSHAAYKKKEEEEVKSKPAATTTAKPAEKGGKKGGKN
jgi:small subunit ribosomal protein S27Ae